MMETVILRGGEKRLEEDGILNLFDGGIGGE